MLGARGSFVVFGLEHLHLHQHAVLSGQGVHVVEQGAKGVQVFRIGYYPSLSGYLQEAVDAFFKEIQANGKLLLKFLELLVGLLDKNQMNP